MTLVRTDVDTGLRVHVGGKSGDHAILLIHGMGGGLSNWSPVQQCLRDWPTVAVELPWHGSSTPRLACDTVDALIDLVGKVALGAHAGTFTAVGHSLGGPIALGLAARHPDRFRQVVLVSGHLFTLGGMLHDGRWADRRLRRALRQARIAASTPMPAWVRAGLSSSRMLRAVMLPPFFNPALIPNASRVGDSLSDHTGRGTRRVYRLIRSARLDEAARRCPVPVAVAAGGRDPLLRAADIEMARALLDVSVYRVFPDCSHWILLERPAELADMIAGFAGDVVRSAGHG